MPHDAAGLDGRGRGDRDADGGAAERPVGGSDLALAVAASGVVRLVATEVGLVDLVIAWLGPMTLLLALSLVLAMWIGPNVSLGVAAALWMLRVATVGIPELSEGWLAARMQEVWATSQGPSR